MAQAIPFLLQAVSTAAIVGGGAALAKSLKPGDLKTPTLPEKGKADESAARASARERRRLARRRGRGSTILTRGGLLSQANVRTQTLGGA